MFTFLTCFLYVHVCLHSSCGSLYVHVVYIHHALYILGKIQRQLYLLGFCTVVEVHTTLLETIKVSYVNDHDLGSVLAFSTINIHADLKFVITYRNVLPYIFYFFRFKDYSSSLHGTRFAIPESNRKLFITTSTAT